MDEQHFPILLHCASSRGESIRVDLAENEWAMSAPL